MSIHFKNIIADSLGRDDWKPLKDSLLYDSNGTRDYYRVFHNSGTYGTNAGTTLRNKYVRTVEKAYNKYNFSDNVKFYATSDQIVLKSDGAGGYTETALGDLVANDQMYFNYPAQSISLDKVENREWYVYGWINAGGTAGFDKWNSHAYIKVPNARIALASTELKGMQDSLVPTISSDGTSYYLANSTTGIRKMVYNTNDGTDSRVYIFSGDPPTITQFYSRPLKGQFPYDDISAKLGPIYYSRGLCYLAGAFDAIGTLDSTTNQENISITTPYLRWAKHLKELLWNIGVYANLSGAKDTGDWPNGQHTYTLRTGYGHLTRFYAAVPIRRTDLVLSPIPTPTKELPKYISTGSDGFSITGTDRLYDRQAYEGAIFDYSCCEGNVWFR